MYYHTDIEAIPLNSPHIIEQEKKDQIDYVKLLMAVIIIVLLCFIWIPCKEKTIDFPDMASINT